MLTPLGPAAITWRTCAQCPKRCAFLEVTPLSRSVEPSPPSGSIEPRQSRKHVAGQNFWSCQCPASEGSHYTLWPDSCVGIPRSLMPVLYPMPVHILKRHQPASALTPRALAPVPWPLCPDSSCPGPCALVPCALTPCAMAPFARLNQLEPRSACTSQLSGPVRGPHTPAYLLQVVHLLLPCTPMP